MQYHLLYVANDIIHDISPLYCCILNYDVVETYIFSILLCRRWNFQSHNVYETRDSSQTAECPVYNLQILQIFSASLVKAF